jgi:hypothetical protein
MKAHPGCECRGPNSVGPRRAGVLGALVPASLLLFLPKCPLCVAAYVAAFTGIGVSVATISHVKFVLMLLCVVSLFYLLAHSSFFRRHAR